MYVTPAPAPPVLGSGSMPSARAVAYEASPMMPAGPVSPTTAYSTLPAYTTATTLPPLIPAPEKSHTELRLGTTTYGSSSAFSGRSPEVWKAVSPWNHGSVSVLQALVNWPSQSMSRSACQKTAPFAPHTGTEGVAPSSVR